MTCRKGQNDLDLSIKAIFFSVLIFMALNVLSKAPQIV
jgi:hypothetical protein